MKGAVAPLILLSALALIALIPLAPASGQPRWSFEAEILPHTLYMGEWGRLPIRVINYQCGDRIPSSTLHFDQIYEGDLREMLGRADWLRERGLISNYTLDIKRAWGHGGDVFYEADLTVYDACLGAAIRVKRLALWFAWRNEYGGRDRAFVLDVNRELAAFDSIAYILEGEGVVERSSVVADFEVFIPPIISPEELASPPGPFLDITVDYPAWREYTFDSYPTRGGFEIQPYRTFNLTLTDYLGEDRLIGQARIILRRLIHYYDMREYVTDSGVVRVERLKEDRYDVEVYWNSSVFNQEAPLVYKGIHSAYDLAVYGLRVGVLPVEVRVLDLQERPLEGARVSLDGVEAFTNRDGWVRFPLVPFANHSLEVEWRGYRLYEAWRWVGYHPTIAPEVERARYVITLPVDDLRVNVRDVYGNLLPANITLIDPRGVIPRQEVYSGNGTWTFPLLPGRDFEVRASTYSAAFKAHATASANCTIGVCDVILPLYSVKLEVVNLGGKPLENATVRLGPVERRTDGGGIAIIPGVPEGSYPLEVSWRGVPVYSEVLRVSSVVERRVTVNVYHASIRLLTDDGRPYTAYWSITDASGAIHGAERASDLIVVDDLPPGPCWIVVTSPDHRITFKFGYQAQQLANMSILKLPIGNVEIRVLLGDGRPLPRVKVQISKEGETVWEGEVDQAGRAEAHELPYGRYMVTVLHPGAGVPLLREELDIMGGGLELRVGCAPLEVRVVDALGNPLRGAHVEVSYGSIILASGFTDNAGSFRVGCAPELQAYKVVARYGRVEAGDLIRPNESRWIQVNVVSLGGWIMPVEQFGHLVMLPSLMLAVILIVLVAIRVARKKRAEER